jgi:signal transduction histidine kinase
MAEDQRPKAELISELTELRQRLEGLEWLHESHLELEQQFEEGQRQEQTVKMEALGQLTAGIAHNFNNLLQTIVGSLELAQTQDMPDEADDAVTQALDTTRRAGELIAQLMIFARPNSRRTQRAIDLAKVAQDVVSICKKTFDRRIEIVVDIKPGQFAIGDSMQLEQAVLNLCINARDALEEVERNDPTIRLGLETLKVDRPTAAANAGSGLYARLSVSDNGIGMDQEIKEKIFDPFFTTKEIDRGTGLGLSTVFGIVRDHGGWIECDSEPGIGARFNVFLPAAPAQTERRAVSREAETTGTETILIIEDEEMIRYTAQRMLEAKGYTTLTAADGDQGLEVFDRERQYIDLVLLDHSLPGKSGRQVLKQLKQRDARTKIIIFTGLGGDKDDFEGADELIHKPVSMITLMSKIRGVLDCLA